MDYDMIIAWSMDMDLEGGIPVDDVFPVVEEERRRNRLCKELLDLISDSVLTFRPSKSLGSLNNLRDHSEPAVEIDIVISGGGLKGYFMSGCSHILLGELAKQNVKIARIAGASAGAWCGLFMMCDIGTETWVETYYKCKERPGMTMHEAYTELWPWMMSNLPENAWEICNKRLFVSVTEVTMFGCKNHMISEYTCNEDLFEACIASSTVPYISLPTMLRRYKDMWCVDGGVTNNTPVFPDNVRRQLVFNLGDVFYPLKFWINPHDLCIESLVVRGAILMSRFLQGEPSDAFAWLNPSGFIDSVKERKGLRNARAAKVQEDFIEQQQKSRATVWRYVLITAGVAAVAGGGLYLYRTNKKTNLSDLLGDTRIDWEEWKDWKTWKGLLKR